MHIKSKEVKAVIKNIFRNTLFMLITFLLLLECLSSVFAKVATIEYSSSVTSVTAEKMGKTAPEIQPFPGQVNPYKTRSELLMKATNYVGAVTPEQASTIWAEGLRHRSAAMQYIVMTEKLKSEYANQLDTLNSNWVTGMSSPWVGGFTFEKIIQLDEIHAEVYLKFEIVSTTSPPKYYNAKLWLIKEKDFWRIQHIWTDKELFFYTLY